MKVKEGDQEFSLTTLKDELGKTYTGSAAVLVVFSRSVGANLANLCRREGALVLAPGQYYYHTGRDSLVAVSDSQLTIITPGGTVRLARQHSCRNVGSFPQWQGEEKARPSRGTVSFRGAHYALANDDCKGVIRLLEEGLQQLKEIREKGGKQQISSFVIDKNLEVVVLHPDAYRGFLGPQVFGDIGRVAGGGSDDVDLLGLLSCPVAGVHQGRPTKRARSQCSKHTSIYSLLTLF